MASTIQGAFTLKYVMALLQYTASFFRRVVRASYLFSPNRRVYNNRLTKHCSARLPKSPTAIVKRDRGKIQNCMYITQVVAYRMEVPRFFWRGIICVVQRTCLPVYRRTRSCPRNDACKKQDGDGAKINVRFRGLRRVNALDNVRVTCNIT